MVAPPRAISLPLGQWLTQEAAFGRLLSFCRGRGGRALEDNRPMADHVREALAEQLDGYDARVVAG